MVRVKAGGRGGRVHLIPGAQAWTALCGTTHNGLGWLVIRPDVTIWGDCKRCAAIKAKADGPPDYPTGKRLGAIPSKPQTARGRALEAADRACRTCREPINPALQYCNHACQMAYRRKHGRD